MINDIKISTFAQMNMSNKMDNKPSNNQEKDDSADITISSHLNQLANFMHNGEIDATDSARVALVKQQIGSESYSFDSSALAQKLMHLFKSN